MTEGLRQGRGGKRGAVHRSHYPVGQQKIAEERSDQQIIAEQAMEEWPRKNIPSNRIGYGSENPVQLSQHGPPIVERARH